MSSIKTHLVQQNETLSSISKLYNCNIESILSLNPILKFNKLTIGHLIYIQTYDFEITHTHKELSNKITFLNKEIFTSYINMFNDYLLIENKLFTYYQKLSITLFETTNDQNIFTNNLKELHNTLINFIDDLQKQDNTLITKSKENISNQINTLFMFFNSKKINISISTISSIIESRLLMIAKILNNNYYDVWKLIENTKKEQ